MSVLNQILSSLGGAEQVGNVTLVAEASTGNDTTSAINTTGATLIVAFVGQSTSGVSMSDSKGNTWTALTEVSLGGTGEPYNRIFYCLNPTVGSGHTFSNSGAEYASIAVIALKHATLSTPAIDGSNYATTGVQPGSITPTGDDRVFIATLVYFTGAPITITINAGFLKQSQVDDLTSYGVVLAYKSQKTSAAENPTWTIISNYKVPQMVCFKFS